MDERKNNSCFFKYTVACYFFIEMNYQGKIRTIEHLGAETIVSIDYNQTELLALVQGNFSGNRGDKINFDIDSQNLLYFNEKREKIL